MAQILDSKITYVCDRCGVTQVNKPFRLKGTVRIQHDLLDYQGAAVAGFDKKLELCDPCLAKVMQTVLSTWGEDSDLRKQDEVSET